MVAIDDLQGSITCSDDSANCILDGENSRRLMYMSGDGNLQQTTIRALTLQDGQGDAGGGLSISGSVKLEIILCVFTSCTATGSEGGGAIHYDGTADAEVNIYASRFERNTVTSSGADIYRKAGLVTVRTTCPAPFESFPVATGDDLETFGSVSGSPNTFYCYFVCPAGSYNGGMGDSSSDCNECASDKYSYSGSTYCSISQWQVTNISELFNKVSENGASKMAGEKCGSEVIGGHRLHRNTAAFFSLTAADSRRWGSNHVGREHLSMRYL